VEEIDLTQEEEVLVTDGEGDIVSMIIVAAGRAPLHEAVAIKHESA
jgi:hypothetical protein